MAVRSALARTHIAIQTSDRTARSNMSKETLDHSQRVYLAEATSESANDDRVTIPLVEYRQVTVTTAPELTMLEDPRMRSGEPRKKSSARPDGKKQ